jgi:hypothetical protein
MPVSVLTATLKTTANSDMEMQVSVWLMYVRKVSQNSLDPENFQKFSINLHFFYQTPVNEKDDTKTTMKISLLLQKLPTCSNVSCISM